MNKPDLNVEAIIVPNATNDYPPPSYYCNLLENNDYKAILKKRLS